MEYEWKINTPSQEKMKAYQSDNRIVAAALCNRGISITAARNMILNGYDGIYNPVPLIHREEAAALLKQFLENKEGHIYIFGDYDTDGITSVIISLGCIHNFHCRLYPDNTEWKMAYKVPERDDG